MAFLISVLPILFTIAIGTALVQMRILPKEQWAGIETLSFRLLIPVVLIASIARAELDLDTFGPMVIAIGLTLLILGALVLGLRVICSQATLPDARLTTLFQTTIRWNAFIALAAAEAFAGPQGVTLVAVAMAAFIPLINIACIVVLSVFGAAKSSLSGVLMLVAQNPLVQGCAIGIALNLSGITLFAPIDGTLDLIGRGALGIGLLAVGAGLDPKRLMGMAGWMWVGVALRMLIAPAVLFATAIALNLSPEATLIGLLVVSVPAASNGYIVAKKMGGDADLYADILAWQTILTAILLPSLAAIVLTN